MRTTSFIIRLVVTLFVISQIAAAPALAEVPLVGTERTEVSKALSQNEIRNLPLYGGREFQRLAELVAMPNVSMNKADTNFGTVIPFDYGRLLDRQITTKFTGNGINSVHAEVTNRTDGQLNFDIHPGMVFLSADPMSQHMACTRPIRSMIGPWETKVFDIPSACTDINTNPPSPMVHFTPAFPVNYRLPLLCTDIGQGPRGPSSQAKMWIFTNHSSIDQINDKLIPGVTPGNYLNSIYTVSKICQIDLTDQSYAKNITNDLITGTQITPGATRWFVDYKYKYDPIGLVKTIDDYSINFKNQLLNSPTDYYLRHYADLSFALCENPKWEIRQSGYRFLTNAIPDTARGQILKFGGKTLINQSLLSNDPNDVLAGLDLAGQYNCPIQHNIFDVLQNNRTDAKWGEVKDKLPARVGLSYEWKNAIGEINPALPSTLDIRQGLQVPQDFESFGKRYNEKADLYLGIKYELPLGGNKLEYLGQTNKGIDLLFDGRWGYNELYKKAGRMPPIGGLSYRFTSACTAIKSLAPFDKTIATGKVTGVENALDGLGYRGLDDFKMGLVWEVNAIKTVAPPK
jgi:hypothetical protein